MHSSGVLASVLATVLFTAAPAIAAYDGLAALEPVRGPVQSATRNAFAPVAGTGLPAAVAELAYAEVRVADALVNEYVPEPFVVRFDTYPAPNDDATILHPYWREPGASYDTGTDVPELIPAIVVANPPARGFTHGSVELSDSSSGGRLVREAPEPARSPKAFAPKGGEGGNSPGTREVSRFEAGPQRTTSLVRALEPGEGTRGLALALALVVIALAPLAVLLFSRLTGTKILAHPTRERLLAVLSARPGRTASELARETSVSLDAAMYHVDRLRRGGFVAVERVNGRDRYFVPGKSVAPLREAALATQVARAITLALAQSPGLTLAQTRRAVGLSRSLCHYHLKGLVDAGVLVASGEGRAKRYATARED